MKQHLAHQDEKRNRHQRELSNRNLLVAHHLFEAGNAAEDQVGAANIDNEKYKRDRQRHQQQQHLGGEHHREDGDPAHGNSSGRMPGTPSVGACTTAGGVRIKSISISSACSNMASDDNGMIQSSHHCGKIRSLNTSVPPR